MTEFASLNLCKKYFGIFSVNACLMKGILFDICHDIFNENNFVYENSLYFNTVDILYRI